MGRVQDGTLSDSHPLCWFPLDLTPESIVVSAAGSSIVVRYADASERFLVIDTSKAVFP